MAVGGRGPNVVLGVGGGIAAYKVCEVLRLLTESGHAVRVVPTASALRFVGSATWAALSGQPVTAGMWDDVQDVPHVRLGREAALVLVAPATADLLAKAAHGIADDLLTATLLTATCPVVMVPAMHTEMWQHPATTANVAVLRGRGVTVLEPASGRLTGADSGPGRLPDPAEIVAAAEAALAGRPSPRTGAEEALTGRPTDLAGRRVVVSAGGTREFLDPVRFVGNLSSGRQGVALAAAALARGADVVLVAANVDAVTPPPGADVVRVRTTDELRTAMASLAATADAVVMAAAPADYRPASVSAGKIRKEEAGESVAVQLVRTPDVLAELSARRTPGQVVVGFAAETADGDTDPLARAKEKLARKGCDLLVVNDVSDGKVFGRSDTEAFVLASDGSVTDVPPGPKSVLADVVWDLVVARWP